jgi:small-conductance mechanosensitive channel
VQVLSWSLVTRIYFVAALLVLGRFNIPVSSLLTLATVAGVAG